MRRELKSQSWHVVFLRLKLLLFRAAVGGGGEQDRVRSGLRGALDACAASHFAAGPKGEDVVVVDAAEGRGGEVDMAIGKEDVLSITTVIFAVAFAKLCAATRTGEFDEAVAAGVHIRGEQRILP